MARPPNPRDSFRPLEGRLSGLSRKRAGGWSGTHVRSIPHQMNAAVATILTMP